MCGCVPEYMTICQRTYQVNEDIGYNYIKLFATPYKWFILHKCIPCSQRRILLDDSSKSVSSVGCVPVASAALVGTTCMNNNHNL